MVWLRVEDTASDHPKVEAISDPALRLWFKALCYAARYLTNGLVPPSLLERRDLAAELVRVGLWEQDEAGRVWIHDFTDYNPTADEVRARRSSDAARHRRFLARARAVNPNNTGNGVTHGVSNGRSNDTPVPSRPVEEIPPLTPPSRGGGIRVSKRDLKREQEIRASYFGADVSRNPEIDADVRRQLGFIPSEIGLGNRISASQEVEKPERPPDPQKHA